MIWRDKNNMVIQDQDVILFKHEDKIEPTGFDKYATDVQLCFWSEIEKRYIPFKETFDHSFIKESEIIKLKSNKL